MLSKPPVSSSVGLGESAAERLVEKQLQARREEFAQGISRYIAPVCAAVSIALAGVWVLDQSYFQILLYAGLLLLLALGAGIYPILHQRNRTSAGLVIVNGLSLVVILAGPLLVPSLLPVVGITDVIAIMIGILLLGDRGSRWLVGAFALAFMADVLVVAILKWSPFPQLEHSIELWITGAVSLVGMVTAILLIRLIVLGLEQQFRLAQRLNFELEQRMQEVNEAQATLKDEHDLLRTLIDHLPDYIFIKDADGRFVNSNTAHNRIAGVNQAEELRGKSALDVFPSHLAVQFDKDDQYVLQTGQALVNVERTSLDADRHERTMLTTKVPLRDAAGSITGLVGISRDISERKQAEQVQQAQEEAERRFQTALKTLFEITIELTQIDGLDDFYRRVVELALARLGFDRFGLLLYDAEQSRLIGTYGTDAQGNLVNESQIQFEPATLTDMLKRTLGTRERVVLDEHSPLFSNLKPIGVGWNAVALLRNGEQSFGWIAADNGVHHQPVSQSLLDVLALYAETVGTLLGRKHAEQALRANEAKLKTFFEVLPVGISVLNRDDQMVEMNPALERILGVSMDGRFSGAYRSRKYISSDGRALEPSEFPSARVRVEAQTVRDIIIGVVKEDETTVWTSVSVAPLPGANAGVITVTTDITEQRRAEQQALDLRNERQRVQVLHRFIGDATHDLMTPIAGINLSADLARRAPDRERLIGHLDKIDTLSQKLQNRLQDMLTMSQLDMMTAQELELRTVDLAQLLQGLVETYRPRAQAKSQQLHSELDPDVGTIQADGLYLRMALAAVVENAIHYTEDGGTIHIALTRHQGEIAIVVEDTGIGIAEADLGHIFERFYRAKDHRPLDAGSGLGLSIAQRIVELHHGRVEVSSVLGSGSTFTILLPDNG